MRESKIEAKLRTGVESIGGMCVKLSPIGYAGIPDRMCLLPGARVVFVELKQKGKPLRKLQDWWMRRLNGLGFKHYKIDTVEGVSDFVRIHATPIPEAGD